MPTGEAVSHTNLLISFSNHLRRLSLQIQHHFPPAELEPGVKGPFEMLPLRITRALCSAAAVAEAQQHSRDFDGELDYLMLYVNPRRYSL